MTTKLFYSCSGDDSQHIKYRNDAIYILQKQPKNITINELRRDLFFTSCSSWCKDKGELIKLYTDHKQDTLLKEKNTQLYKLFYKSKPLFLYKILEMFDTIEFIPGAQIPKCFKIKIHNARFAWYDGNEKCLIGETNEEYYIFFYYGS